MGLLFFLKCAFVCDAQLIDPGVKISCGAVTVELRNGVTFILANTAISDMSNSNRK
jgi:hypothetical protein